MPQAVEQVAQRAANNQRISILFSFCVAFERYIITARITLYQSQYRQRTNAASRRYRQGTKRRAIVTRIMQIKRREQRDVSPRAKFWRIRYLLPRSIIRRLPPATASVALLNRSIDSSANLRFSPSPATLLTQRPQISRVPPPCRHPGCSASSVGTSHFGFTQRDFQPFEYFALLSITGASL